MKFLIILNLLFMNLAFGSNTTSDSGYEIGESILAEDFHEGIDDKGNDGIDRGIYRLAPPGLEEARPHIVDNSIRDLLDLSNEISDVQKRKSITCSKVNDDIVKCGKVKYKKINQAVQNKKAITRRRRVVNGFRNGADTKTPSINIPDNGARGTVYGSDAPTHGATIIRPNP